MTSSFSKLQRITEALNNTGGGWDDVVADITAIVKEPDGPEGYVPLMMGNQPIGRIRINLETGNFEGRIIKELAGILQDGFAEGVLETSFFGKASIPVEEFQERFRTFLAKGE